MCSQTKQPERMVNMITDDFMFPPSVQYLFLLLFFFFFSLNFPSNHLRRASIRDWRVSFIQLISFYTLLATCYTHFEQISQDLLAAGKGKEKDKQLISQDAEVKGIHVRAIFRQSTPREGYIETYPAL